MTFSDRADLEVRRASRFYVELAYTDRAGSAPNLAGYSATMDIRQRDDVAPAAAGSAILRFSSSPGTAQGTITLGTAGTAVTFDDGTTGTATLITIDAGSNLTGGIAPTRVGDEYVYDFELVAPSGLTEDAPLGGYVTVYPEVTR